MTYGYCRVSTAGQKRDGNSLEDQREKILRKYPDAEIVEEAFSGYHGERPRFGEMMQKAEKGDTIVVTKPDRFCRNSEQGVSAMKALLAKGVRVDILNMGIVEDTAMGKVMFEIMQAFAEFERNMIVERTQAGKAVARKKPGWHEGRPRKYGKMPDTLEEARREGIPDCTWYRRRKEAGREGRAG